MRRFCLTVWFVPVLLTAGQMTPDAAVEQRFAELRKSPPELYAFLLRMPKGGDLHIHMGGAVYAETYLRFAAEDGLCVDLKAHAIVSPPCGESSIEAAKADNALTGLLIDSMSMRNFVPGRESGHDHFFAAFNKFGPARPARRAEFLAEVIRRAAAQNESYLEVMTLSGAPVNAIGTRSAGDGGFAAAKDRLFANGLEDAVKQLSATVDELDQNARLRLGCDAAPDMPACRVVVRHIYQVLRETPKDQIFAQIIAGMMLASSNPRVAGINFVQPEDGAISMRDYHLQMQMVDYAKSLYPRAHISLHAGELAAGLVPSDGLRFHIREAIELGHAERIGHGVSVMYEDGAENLLNEMRQRHVMVEINLTSNDGILGIRGQNHPLPVYRKFGVPVALATDDEGVARTHLTEEYQRAVLTYGLRYADVQTMARNSIEYSFLAGASLWQNHNYGVRAAVCTRRETRACSAFLESSEKARMQADLEDRFVKFERSVTYPQNKN